MSVYKRCSQAVREMAQGPDTFTELDVINRACQNSWTESDYKKAMTQANQIAYAWYRSGRLARFGPVDQGGQKDYVRRASKIVYVDPNGIQSIMTPNGRFPRLMVYDDEIGSVGRRSGTNRDDFHPWPEEVTSDGYENLKQQVTELRERVSELEQELEKAPVAA